MTHCTLWCDRVNIGEQAIKVAQNLPAGYLSCEQTGAHRPVLQCGACSNNNRNNNNGGSVCGAIIMTVLLSEFYGLSDEYRTTSADSLTMSADLSSESACRLLLSAPVVAIQYYYLSLGDES